MDASVGQIRQPIISVDMDTTVQDILDQNPWHKVSAVVVLDKNKSVVGIVSEKDMIYAESLGIKKKDIKAWQVCSRNIVKIDPNDTVIGAARLMVENKVHNVLIMTGDYVEGIASSLDVLKACLDLK